MTAPTQTRHLAADFLPDSGSGAVYTMADLKLLARTLVALYIAADDVTAEEMRAEVGESGPRPAGAASRWARRGARDSLSVPAFV